MDCIECGGDRIGDNAWRHRAGCTQPGAGGYQWLFCADGSLNHAQRWSNSYAHLDYTLALPRISCARIDMDADELLQHISWEYGPPKRFRLEMPLPEHARRRWGRRHRAT